VFGITKRASLLVQSMNYDAEKFYNTGPAALGFKNWSHQIQNPNMAFIGFGLDWIDCSSIQWFLVDSLFVLFIELIKRSQTSNINGLLKPVDIYSSWYFSFLEV